MKASTRSTDLIVSDVNRSVASESALSPMANTFNPESVCFQSLALQDVMRYPSASSSDLDYTTLAIHHLQRKLLNLAILTRRRHSTQQRNKSSLIDTGIHCRIFSTGTSYNSFEETIKIISHHDFNIPSSTSSSELINP